ncbi:hypothetical protein K661_02976 [Piscirickettsia salmonis LF-89 = ATCC VR-1361]|nr:hypothetical protein K661_02976 [Piscirickettsia salmonis LF-89 = ATCC VR-1361]
MLQTYGLSQLRSAKNPHLPRPTHPVPCTPWLAAIDKIISFFIKFNTHITYQKQIDH